MDTVDRAIGILCGSAGGEDLLLSETLSWWALQIDNSSFNWLVIDTDVLSSVHVDVLDEHIARLEHNFLDLQDQVFRLIVHSKCRRNALLAVSRLPVEVFVEIAAHVLHDSTPPFDYAQNMRILMLVCKQWHDVVGNTPSLWSHLRPSFPLAYNAAALLKSKSSTLEVWQPPNYTHEDPQSYATFINMILPEVPRWCAVRISPAPLDEPGLRALSQHAPMLSSFAMDLNSWTPDNNPPQPIDLFGGYAPRLRDLKLVAVPVLHTWPILKGLTSLDLTFPGYARPPTTDVLQVVAQCPDLTNLVLSDRNSYSDDLVAGDPPTKSLQLPQLLHLTLDYLDMDMFLSFFCNISAPNCIELTIHSTFEETFSSIPMPSSHQLAGSFPTIHQRLKAAQKVIVLDPSMTSVEVVVRHGDGFCLDVDFGDYDLCWTLDWLAQVVPELKEKQANLDFQGANIGEKVVLGILDERLDVVGLFTPSDGDTLESVEGLLEYLATPNVKSNTLQWPFPNLDNFAIHTAKVNPSSVLKMLKSRYGIPNWSPVGNVVREVPRPLDRLYVSDTSFDEEAWDEVERLLEVVVSKDGEYPSTS